MEKRSNVQVSVECLSSVIEQALDDIANFLKFSSPENIKQHLSTTKMSPSCALHEVELWFPSDVENAWSFFEKGYEIALSESEYWSPHENSLLHFEKSAGELMETFLRRRHGHVSLPLAAISFEVEGEEPKTEGSRRIYEAIKKTRDGDLVWTMDHDSLPLFRKEILKRVLEKQSYRCLVSSDEQSFYFLVRFGKCCKGRTPQKEYAQYFLLIVDTDSLEEAFGLSSNRYSFFSSVGKLWKVVDSINGTL